MDLINLEVLDAPMIDQTDFGPDMDRWLTNVVDIINSSFGTISQVFTNLIVAQSADIGGGGATVIVTVPGLSSSGFVYCNLISTTNVGITISSIVPGTNNFTVNFSGNPGASAIITYQAYTSKPQ